MSINKLAKEYIKDCRMPRKEAFKYAKWWIKPKPVKPAEMSRLFYKYYY